ncbi:hypothetical protein ACGFX8_33480 [Streptomyces sp. NPDC048362]|uniref:bestrophin-like domain n=1 Tax=Streptomyces sp. NPDC048362 TaxID=3365539 RepID=UPI003714C2E2
MSKPDEGSGCQSNDSSFQESEKMSIDVQILEWPTVVQFIVFTGGFLLIAMISAIAFRWLSNFKGIEPSSETLALILGVYGAIYGVLLAFVIVIAWEDLNAASSRVTMESAALASVVRDASFFPVSVRDEISHEMRDYIDYTVNVEWRDMRKGRAPRASNPSLDDMLATVRSYTPDNTRGTVAYERMLTDLNTATTERRGRIGESQQHLPQLLQWFIFGGAICVVLLAAGYRPKSILDQVLLLGSLSLLLSSSLLIVLGLNHPFSGDISVSPDSYYSGILAQYRP